MSQIIRRPAANRDLVTAFRYYAREASLRVADRFFAEAETTFARLATMPGIGTRYEPPTCNPVESGILMSSCVDLRWTFVTSDWFACVSSRLTKSGSTLSIFPP
jgi:plasmid stabilization system protein ParE